MLLPGSVKKQCMAAAVALCIALEPAVGVGLASAETITGQVEKLSPSTIDATARATVTVRKIKPNPFNKGAHQGPEPRPASGRTLTVMRVAGIDITTKAGFEKAQRLTPAELTDATFVDKQTVVTDSDGVAVFRDLKPGLYFLGEPIDPKFVGSLYNTVPMLFTVPQGDAGRWSYDIVLDSKDQVEDHEDKVKPKTPAPKPGQSGSSVIPLIPLVFGGVLFGSQSSGPMNPPVIPVKVTPAPTPAPTPVPTTPVVPEKPGLHKLPMTGANVDGVGLFGALLSLLGAIIIASAVMSRRKA